MTIPTICEFRCLWRAGDTHRVTIEPKGMTGSLQLKEYPGEIVRLSCHKCGRAGQYRKQTLIERYGADMRLPMGLISGQNVVSSRPSITNITEPIAHL